MAPGSQTKARAKAVGASMGAAAQRPRKDSGSSAAKKRPRVSVPAGEMAEDAEEEDAEQENAEEEDEDDDHENGDVENGDAAEDMDDEETNGGSEAEEEVEAPPPKKKQKKAAAAAKAKANGSTATKATNMAKPKATTAKATKAKPKAATKSKADAKPKTTAKATKAKAAKAKEPKKRKTRTLADKQAENTPVATAFYVETGGEWHATNVDFDELGELRALWELPAACHVLWLLQQPLSLRVANTLLEFEAALLSPETSTLLEDVFTKLLLKKSERDCLAPGIGLKYEWWNKQLREYYMALYDKWFALLRKAGEKSPGASNSFLGSDSDSDENSNSTEEEEEEDERDVELSDDEWLALDILKSRLEGLGTECPLKHRSFSELPIDVRCRILLNLCEAVVDDPVNTEYIRQMEEDDLRVEPLGRDRVGNWFYYFPQFYDERRLYRLEVETNKWELWAKGDDAFRQMLAGMKQVRGRKMRGEQDLIDHLEVIVEQIEEEAEARSRQVEKATRKAILEAIPRKRSERIQVKQLEQMEKQKEVEEAKKVLTLEELAEIKRAELLRKVEQEAEREAREREREARRVQREEQEKEAALAEREERRQRRLEKEKKDEELALQMEEERKRQEDARKQRALQRQAAEAAERANASANGGDVNGSATE